MDEVAVNKSFFVGYDRTIDLLELVPLGEQGEAEIVGIFIASIGELAQRWDMTEREAIKNVARVIPKD